MEAQVGTNHRFPLITSLIMLMLPLVLPLMLSTLLQAVLTLPGVEVALSNVLLVLNPFVLLMGRALLLLNVVPAITAIPKCSFHLWLFLIRNLTLGCRMTVVWTTAFDS